MKADNVKNIPDLIQYVETLVEKPNGDSFDEVLRLLRRVQGGKEPMATITLTTSEIIDRSSNILINLVKPHSMEIVSGPIYEFFSESEISSSKKVDDANILSDILYGWDELGTSYNIIFFNEETKKFNFVHWKQY